MVNEENPAPDLASLALQQVGALKETGDPWEPFQLLDAGGMVIAAGQRLLEGPAGRRAKGGDPTLVWHGPVALVPVLVDDRGAVGRGDSERGSRLLPLVADR